ncbi:MAG: universal stress protein [Actinobacteria bacterium]|nr:MAG: universal stress protein [Actinomycetota bacterium]
MGPKVIVSYDDTANDRDALALGRVFASAGATVSLAYVRHTKESEHAQERLEEREAQALLERGAQALGGNVQRHVVLSASTGEGLWQLAERERADIVVFGSEYRTPVGRVSPGTSATRLLEGAPAAVALAPAGLRDRDSVQVERIGLIPDDGDESAEETAKGLAARLGAKIASSIDEPVDLLVVGSRPEAPEGRVMISASVEYAIENAFSPVLVVPRGVVLPFEPRQSPRLTTA